MELIVQPDAHDGVGCFIAIIFMTAPQKNTRIGPIPRSKPDFTISGQVGVKVTGDSLAAEWRKYLACVAQPQGTPRWHLIGLRGSGRIRALGWRKRAGAK